MLRKDAIQARVAELAQLLETELDGRPTTFVGILDGALFFMTDLIRAMKIDVQVDFLRITSYHGETKSGDLKVLSGLTWNVAGKNVVIVDDILDTGKTLYFCIEHLLALGANEVRTIVLLAKDRKWDYHIENPYVGFRIPDRFVIGYGLDYQGRFRHLTDIYARGNQD